MYIFLYVMLLEILASISILKLKKAKMEEREMPFNRCIISNDSEPTFLTNPQAFSHTHAFTSLSIHTHIYKQLQREKHCVAFMSLL